MHSLVGEDRIKDQVSKIRDKGMKTEGLVGSINIARIGVSSLDEGIFPEEVLEVIEARRQQILAQIMRTAELDRSTVAQRPDLRHRQIEEVKASIRLLVLDIERIYAQTGRNCVQECSDMLQELEEVKQKYLTKKAFLSGGFKWSAAAILCLSILIYMIRSYLL
ncbi:hypothetical protein NEHOM01_2190 [Nematocida homosporus]|uniref:uncharacterized protein n=1 Tax=Nematocida homosporus TaxID=1912981 RepID=UPI00221F7C1E|nr:uncharacterized protein NEHOM01_2190 [Nematocida homosporus]KAI5187454.1 hypothetical protein NEHOM01_2190 [Nematocida homosporus]